MSALPTPDPADDGATQRLDKIARHAPGILYQFHLTADAAVGHFPYVSERCRALLGVPPQELMRDARAMFAAIAHEDRERVWQSIVESMREMSQWRAEFRIRRQDGSVRWLLGLSSPQREADGSVLWHGYIQDVTDMHELERARQEKAAAEAASRAKTEFLSRMSHELRTPLNAVLGFSQLLEIDRQEPLSAGQRRRVAQIREAGEHLLEMIGDLLDLTRIEAGQLPVRIEAVTVGEVVHECLALLSTQAEHTGVRLLAGELAPELRVRGDRTRLKQVLINLLSNAIKYNRPAGSVQVRGECVGNELRLSVVDTGVGIAPADQRRLFEPFNRLAHSRSAIEGSGIGLSVTRALVELMHGRIEVQSQRGVGSTFSVTLPSA
jgi:PAS domain S-box-containing protein